MVITGIAGTSITATTAVSDSGQPIGKTESASTAQSMCNDLATISTGTCTIAGVKTFSGGVTLGAACKLVGTSGCEVRGTLTADTSGPVTTFTGFSWVFDAASMIKLLGRKVLQRARPTTLTDADHSVDVSQGDRFTMPSVTAATRTITLINASTVPLVGERLVFFCEVAGLTNDLTGAWFKFVREDASTAAVVYAATGLAVGVLDQFWLEFEYVGSAWKLATNSGSGYDGGGGLALSPFYGVRLS